VQNSTRVSGHISAVRAPRDSRFEIAVSQKHDEFNATNRNALRAPAEKLSHIELALHPGQPHFHTSPLRQNPYFLKNIRPTAATAGHEITNTHVFRTFSASFTTIGRKLNFL
jgi:hypothetical protein